MDKNTEMARRIATLVSEAGGRTFYVGGLVRDTVLGRENKDVDIEIHGITPQKLEEILDSVGKRTVMGASFGIFGLQHYDLDIAMPRSETSNGCGHRDFDVFVDPFIGTEKAALRRDFTMNALMQDVLTGEIIDHFGGIGDLKNGVIRHVNDVTFAEDPLRVLRAAQFAARFSFNVADETRELSRRMDLTALAAERIEGELNKALTRAPHPSVFFDELRRMDQLAYWFPVMEKLSRDPEPWRHAMLALDAAAAMKKQAEDPLGLLYAAACPEAGELARHITRNVKLVTYVSNMSELRGEIKEHAVRSAGADEMATLYDRAVSPKDLILLYTADQATYGLDCARQEAYLNAMLAEYERRMSLPYVMGKDLIDAGFKPGICFSPALKLAHDLQLKGVSKQEALEKTCEYLRQKTDEE